MAALDHAGAQTMPLSRHTGYDLRNENEALQAMLATHPDIVVHLAGVVGGIGANVKQPATFFRDNMLMGMNVVHAASVGRAKIITVGTVCSYPKDGQLPFEEEAFWDGFPEPTNAPYGIAKKALLVMMQAYRKQFGLRFAYLIPSNLYGPGDHFEEGSSHVIPALVRRFVEAKEKGEKEVVCWGSGQVTRSFLFAADAAKAITIAAATLDMDDPVNLPGTEELTIGELSVMIAKLVGYAGKILWDGSKPDGQPRRMIDGTRAKDLLDWEPETKLAEGLKHTIAWYQENRGK